VTGGIWFSGTQFNSQLIDNILLPAVAGLVQNKPGISVYELTRRIILNGVGNLRYQEGEAKQLVDAAISSGAIVNVSDRLYNGPVNPVICPMSRTPCRGCPLLPVCEPGAAVNPVDCPYLTKMSEDF
jgi:hypothetical protein